jgi:hypothetical protein
MSAYIRNRDCPCKRCKTRGLLGAAVLITIGVLFMIQNFTPISFDDTWPVILIVIGVFLYLGRTASTDGHIAPYYLAGPVAPSSAQAVPPQPHDSQVNQ